MLRKDLTPIYKLFLTLSFILSTLSSFGQAKFPTAEIESYYDLDFTQAERDSLLSGLQDYQKSISAIHQYPLDNSVSMSLLFNPLPKGFKVESAQKTVVWNLPKNVTVPARKEDLAFFSVSQLAV